MIKYCAGLQTMAFCPREEIKVSLMIVASVKTIRTVTGMSTNRHFIAVILMKTIFIECQSLLLSGPGF